MATGGDDDTASKASLEDTCAAPSESKRLQSAVERLIYKNKRYLEATLQVTDDLVETFKKVFNAEQIGTLKRALREDPRPAVNHLVVGYALKFPELGHDVDKFLLCLEQHQPEIPWKILSGSKVAEMRGGSRSVGAVIPGLQESGGSGTLSLSGSGMSVGSCQSPCVDYAMHPEPDIDFEDSEFYPVGDEPMSENEEWPSKVEIGPPGGSFHAGEDKEVHLTVPRGALGDTRTLFVVVSDVCEVRQLDAGEVYYGKGLQFGEHDLEFSKEVEVAVRDGKLLGDLGALRVNIFASHTEETSLPDFKDVTEECRPEVNMETGMLTFAVHHFSYYFYTLAAVAVPVAAIALTLLNREVHFKVAAKPWDSSTPDRIALWLSTCFGSNKRQCDTGYVPVSEVHLKLEVSVIEKYVYPELHSAPGHSQSTDLSWKLGSKNQEGLARGMGSDCVLCPIYLERIAKSDREPEPFTVAFRVVTQHHQQTVDVTFTIDPPLLARPAQDQQDLPRPSPTIRHEPPPPPCEADHTDAARNDRMTKNRKQALMRSLPDLVRDTHYTTIPPMIDGLLRCRVLTPGECDYIQAESTGRNQMRRLIEVVETRHNAAFDCFVHAVRHRFPRPHHAKELRKHESQPLEQAE